MELNQFVLVNAFVGPEALGNQCCVLLLEDISDSNRLQNIAADFNLPATTFLKRLSDTVYEVRWFAPTSEIGLCGHGTMAASHLLLSENDTLKEITFNYSGGSLVGRQSGKKISMAGEGIISVETEIPNHVQKGFLEKVVGYRQSPNKDIVLLDRASSVEKMNPDWEVLRTSDTFGYVVTAKGLSSDFVSRVFLPFVPILEDQATGSAHMLLAPFWARQLGKNKLTAKQLSPRRGFMECEVRDSEVILSAHCAVFAQGDFIN